MGNNVRKFCSTVYYYLRIVSHIIKKPTHNSVVARIDAFMFYRLDYRNALLSCRSKELLHKLQLVQNMSVRVITGPKDIIYIILILKSLYWFVVETHIKFNVLLFTFKPLSDATPSYIRDLLIIYEGQRQPRSSSKIIFVVSKTRLKTAAHQTFIYQAATVWIGLLDAIRSMKMVTHFK